MIRCQNCSAPLPAFRGRCEYCGSHNDIDRELLGTFDGAASGYACPGCGAALERMSMGDGDSGVGGKGGDGGKGGEPLTLGRCGKCFGLFFAFYRLEAVLNDLSKYGFLIDAQRLEDLGRNPGGETRIAYRKCPLCGKLMNRVNFGQRSGVVTDQCKGHGVWLDAGELKRLVEWRNSGGQLHDERYRKQQEAERLKKEARDKQKLERYNREADGQGGIWL